MSAYPTGPWVNVTTRPSRPAGLSPPKVKVLGPESLQVRPPCFCLYSKSFKVIFNIEINHGANETDIIYLKSNKQVVSKSQNPYLGTIRCLLYFQEA